MQFGNPPPQKAKKAPKVSSPSSAAAASVASGLQQESHAGKYIVLVVVAVIFGGGLAALMLKGGEESKSEPVVAEAPAVESEAADPSLSSAAGETPSAESALTMDSASTDAAVAEQPAEAFAEAPPSDSGSAEAPPTETAMTVESEPAYSAPAPTYDTAPASGGYGESSSDDSSGIDQETAVVHESKPAPKPSGKVPPPASEVLDAWWRSPQQGPFGVEFVGQAAGQTALVIRLSRAADLAAAAQHIQLIAPDGQAVATNWQSSANGYVIYNPDLTPGRYRVSIDAELASTAGERLGKKVSGPIYIQ